MTDVIRRVKQKKDWPIKERKNIDSVTGKPKTAMDFAISCSILLFTKF
jgi:hypothetical protein